MSQTKIGLIITLSDDPTLRLLFRDVEYQAP